MRQDKLLSLIETITNTLIGFLVSYIAWPVAGWLLDVTYNSGQHFGLVLFFTVLSIARGYMVRRWFESYLNKFCKQLYQKLKGFAND